MRFGPLGVGGGAWRLCGRCARGVYARCAGRMQRVARDGMGVLRRATLLLVRCQNVEKTVLVAHLRSEVVMVG